MAKRLFKVEVSAKNKGKSLRRALIEQGDNPHNGKSSWLNCKGMGTCGTCAIKVLKGHVPPLNARESWRLNFPPHKKQNQLRLACQIELQGPLELEKYPGFWGEKVEA
ncbi:MAG: 2Fe-2S iron-sulfur cluster-binding protein [Croceimicrobium sp.]|nr:(2Fe-2S)-binding protein [Bacteroidota bacterium]